MSFNQRDAKVSSDLFSNRVTQAKELRIRKSPGLQRSADELGSVDDLNKHKRSFSTINPSGITG